jgi:hypothetical protein
MWSERVSVRRSVGAFEVVLPWLVAIPLLIFN